MKDNLFKLLVVGLLTAILIITLSRKQAGRYVRFGDEMLIILDTSTGELFAQEVGHYNIIEVAKLKQKEGDSIRDSKSQANID